MSKGIPRGLSLRIRNVGRRSANYHNRPQNHTPATSAPPVARRRMHLAFPATVTANGRTLEVRAIVDTGAESTMVDEKLVARLGSPPTIGDSFVQLMHRKLKTEHVYAIGLEIFGHAFPLVEVAATDLSFHATGDTDLIVGMDVLEHAILTLDGPAHSFTLDIRETPAAIRWYSGLPNG